MGIFFFQQTGGMSRTNCVDRIVATCCVERKKRDLCVMIVSLIISCRTKKNNRLTTKAAGMMGVKLGCPKSLQRGAVRCPVFTCGREHISPPQSCRVWVRKTLFLGVERTTLTNSGDLFGVSVVVVDSLMRPAFSVDSRAVPSVTFETQRCARSRR